MHNNILSPLSMKVYASKRGRDVRKDDPKDFKIWIDYKMEQIRTWLKRHMLSNWTLYQNTRTK